MDLGIKITSMIEPILKNLKYDLVQVSTSTNNDLCVQIMVEPSDGSRLKLRDCSMISKKLSAIFDIENVINEPFTLEVSSPGIDRPLTKMSDFEKYCGCEIKLELREPQDGQRKFRGTLGGLKGGKVKLKNERAEYLLSHSNILKSKLLITNELLSMNRKG